MARLTVCEKFGALLSRRLDETLTSAQERSLELHLRQCPRCREEERMLRATRAQLRRRAAAPPHRSEEARQRTFARFDARLRQEGAGRRVPRNLLPLRIAVAAAAAAVGFLIPLEPLDAPLPDSQEISALHALHETHSASVLPNLPDSATAEESSEAP